MLKAINLGGWHFGAGGLAAITIGIIPQRKLTALLL
jgi:hypothetical protein